MVSGSTEFSSEIRYSCEEGYYLVGTANHVCKADGTWSGKEPECKGTIFERYYNHYIIE